MIGAMYWSVGITVWQVYGDNGRDQWHAEATFCDDGFCDMQSSEGVIRCRYVGPLSQVVDVVKADAERLGIHWSDPSMSTDESRHFGTATIFYRGDGEHTDIPPAPFNWRDRVNAEATRLGWRIAYRTEVSK